MSTLTLVLTAVGSVLLLLFFVMYARLHAFYCVNDCCYWCWHFSGMPLEKSRKPCQNGMVGTLGFLSIVVAFGAMFGKILHETGALDQIAVRLLKSFGEKRANYALGIAGLVCALPLFSMSRWFFRSGWYLLLPVVRGMLLKWRSSLPVLQGPLPSYCRGQRLCCFADQMNADFWLDDLNWFVCSHSRYVISGAYFW